MSLLDFTMKDTYTQVSVLLLDRCMKTLVYLLNFNITMKDTRHR